MNKRFAMGRINVIIQRKVSCGWIGIFKISHNGASLSCPDFAMKLSDKITSGLLNGASSGERTIASIF